VVSAQTRWRTYKARKFLALMHEAQKKIRFLNESAAKIQKCFRGMKGRQFYEITRNLMALHAISGPLQDQIRGLDIQEKDVKRAFESIQKRIQAQEVCL
jgi:hypothetical protein